MAIPFRCESEAMRKWIYVVPAVAVVLAVLFFYMNSGNGSGSLASYDNAAVSQSLIANLSMVANNASIASSVSIAAGLTSRLSNSIALTSAGKPVVLYVGADYCPYCAAARWGLVLALMRFGNFTSLHYMTSAVEDAYPNTPTFTFYNSTYESGVIDFRALEMTTNKFNSTRNWYDPLESPDALEKQILNKYDAGSSIPFIDFANVSISLGAVSPQVLGGMDWQEIALQLSHPDSTVAQSIIGPANAYTAAICTALNNSARVCSEGYVASIQKAQ